MRIAATGDRTDMQDNRDYTKKGFLLACMVIVCLVGVSFIPPVKVGGMVIKRANILSDIIEYDDSAIMMYGSEQILDTSFLELFKEIPRREQVADTTAVRAAGQLSDSLASGGAGNPSSTAGSPETEAAAVTGIPVATINKTYTVRPHVYCDTIVSIEDFSHGQAMMSRFYNSLAYDSAERTVRIAVLGDSFIEADIITADLREQLQLAYGGGGVGFVPFSTPLSKHRGTIKHTHTGWTNHNIIKHKSVPEEYKKWFSISGMLSIPEEGASVDYNGVKFRSRIETANTATLLFANRKGSSLAVTVNDSIEHTYTPPISDSLGSIRIGHGGISSLGIKVTDADGFIGYGVVLEDSVGVSVHNYSVRSNSGMALLGTDYTVNSRIDSLMNYDLVILQYGLNAMSPDVTDYKYYGRQLVRIIEYVKQCFPRSAILVMSVGDRSSLKNGTAVTMPAVKAMLETQRAAAETTGVGFWNTFEAMGGDNSMRGFVEKKWASKDYTHIGYPGGKYIAGQLVAYLNAAVESIREQREGDLAPLLDIDMPLPGISDIATMQGMQLAGKPNSTGNSPKEDDGADTETEADIAGSDGSETDSYDTDDGAYNFNTDTAYDDSQDGGPNDDDSEGGMSNTGSDSGLNDTYAITYDETDDAVIIEPLLITAPAEAERVRDANNTAGTML